jgi:cytochrome c oxidase subunit III
MLRRYRLALGLWVCGVVMLFVAFISSSIVRRGIPAYENGAEAYSTQWESLPLPIPLLILNSCILFLGWLSLELARRRSAVASSRQPVMQSMSPWIYSAIALGVAFLAGQAMVWRLLQAHGLVMSTSARVAFFYLLTGTHAIQIVIGVLVLIWVVARRTKWTAMGRYIAVDLATWYFSAMAALWIVLFCFLVFA